MKNVDGPAVRLVDETGAALAAVLPESLAVQLGGIAEACREGLMAVAVEAGLARALAMCGGWNARDPERDHVRGGTTPTSVVMGGQRLPIRRPRVHGVVEGERAGEVGLASYGVFAQGDLLGRVAVERMLAGVATRSFARVAGPIGDKAHPDAAGSLREGLEDMFTVRALGIDGTPARTPVCTNMIESMISTCRTTSGNVKRWRDEGDMAPTHRPAHRHHPQHQLNGIGARDLRSRPPEPRRRPAWPAG